MKKVFFSNIAGFIAGLLALWAYFHSQRQDGDPNYFAVGLIAPAAILFLVQLIVWWSIAFSPGKNSGRK